ncbi:MAG: cell wall hydrolase [Patescibacteria group bacterium]
MATLLISAGALLLLPIVPQNLPSVGLPQNPPLISPLVSNEVVQAIPPPPTFEEEAQTLAMALYFEGRTNESDEGLRAIASVIVNRTKLPNFGNTIAEVVSHGANGQTTGGCQFSYQCDEYPEDIELLCRLRPLDLQKHWGENACVKRFEAYLAFAKAYLSNGKDNTGGANMYYAAWMRKRPYWYKELIPGSIVTLGSHVFGRNKRFEPKVALK